MVGEEKKKRTGNRAERERKGPVDRSDSINNDASTSRRKEEEAKKTFDPNMSLQGIDFNSLSFGLKLIFSSTTDRH